MRNLKKNLTSEPMNQCSAGEVPASPETAPFHSGESPESKPHTAPKTTIAKEMNVRRTTETTTTGALSGVSNDKMVKPKPVLADARMPRGIVWQVEPEQQLQPQVQPNGQVRGQVENEPRAWGLATSSPDSTLLLRGRAVRPRRILAI